MTGVRASTFRARKPKCHRMKSSNFRIQAILSFPGVHFLARDVCRESEAEAFPADVETEAC
ncbi:uncharacterized protein [Physcomitrium patens]|uniref:uncharacterized protein isoform X2 n=1 Tax=Physcomitrium patens TaxID=3218 RepID=UPI003CCDC2FF